MVVKHRIVESEAADVKLCWVSELRGRWSTNEKVSSAEEEVVLGRDVPSYVSALNDMRWTFLLVGHLRDLVEC